MNEKWKTPNKYGLIGIHCKKKMNTRLSETVISQIKKTSKENPMEKKFIEYSGYFIHLFSIIAYFVLLFILDIPPALKFLSYFGFLFFGLGILFIMLSVISQRRRETGKIFEQSVYGIVRHPMYLGGIMLFVAMALFLPHWIMFAISLINVVIIYAFCITEERMNIATFGDAYQQYMTRVPRINLVIGLIKLLKRKKAETIGPGQFRD
jgi:protein-S-isoprenylcysteine O-methyltransferase Ste14